MIRMMTAYTTEVDEVEDALNEITGQIDLGALRKNTVGIITCHFDFTNTGFIGALCRKLPFDIIGMTTMASATKYGTGMYALSLTVLTSDDVFFETGLTEPLNSGNYRKKITAAYTDTAQKLPGCPSLIITFFPLLNDLSGALMHRAFDDICGGVPFWGSIAATADINSDHRKIFRNGEIVAEGMVMLLLHGPVDPEFIVVSVPTQNIRKDLGWITESEGCTLKKINGIPALKYMETRGVILKDTSPVTPLMVYYEGSSVPVTLAVYSVNDDGSLLCGGEMPVGALVTAGELTTEGILATAGEGMTRLLECGRRNGALLLPCASRYIMLVPDHNSELSLITDRMENGKIMPYMAGYSGGELCPVRDKSGVLRNRFHNYTFSACVF